MNYSDNSLEHSKLLLIGRPEDQLIIHVPLLPNIMETISSTSRTAFVQNIVALKYWNAGIEEQTLNYKFIKDSELFLIILSNGEFLLYSEFDGRMLEIKSKELFDQSIIQNRALYKEYIEVDGTVKVRHRKRVGNYHAYLSSNDMLIISNGFDYDFYNFEVIQKISNQNLLICEQNLAYEKELCEYNQFPHSKLYYDEYSKEISTKWELDDKLFLSPVRLFPR